MSGILSNAKENCSKSIFAFFAFILIVVVLILYWSQILETNLCHYNLIFFQRAFMKLWNSWELIDLSLEVWHPLVQDVLLSSSPNIWG